MKYTWPLVLFLLAAFWMYQRPKETYCGCAA